MLNKLIIKNVALIDSAEIDFTEGLNVLSGETGSGKSVILESLNFALGAKADKTLISSGKDECFVSAEFDVSNNDEIQAVFDEFEFDREDILIITRKFTIDGKNVVKINGNSATVSMLKKFTVKLIDVHGQSEHFYLLKTSRQLELIDKLGGNKLNDIKQVVKNDYNSYKSIVNELDELGGDEHSRLIRLDIISYQINEIESCDLKENEELELLEVRSNLLNLEKISNALNSLKDAISSEGGVSDILGNAEKIVGGISRISEKYQKLYDKVSELYSELDDISYTASGFLDELDCGDYDLDKIETRLDEIKRIKKKYGSDYKEIYEFLEKIKVEKDNLEHFNERAECLLKEKNTICKRLYDSCKKLSDERRKTAEIFSKNVISELKELSINKAKFEVFFNEFPSFSEFEPISSNGVDYIEFMFSANLGEPLKPLSNVISGGEMSRFMLAIKTQVSKHNTISTFVFDEIDAGISGVVAKTVAEKFAVISKDTQIIAITHLPQISAMADNNLLISKSELSDKTCTLVKKLNSDEKVAEIIRLVGGTVNSESARRHAKELIVIANDYKHNIKRDA